MSDIPFRPAYLQLLQSNDLDQRAAQARQSLTACRGCAWECGLNRLRGEMGICRSGVNARVSSFGPHFGEEKPLSGWRGSGTIFFTRCNLHCQFCQNFDISQTDQGEEVEPEDLAQIMLTLQSYGCHNINLVSPSHVVPQILAAVALAAHAGLHLPLVYNTGGYDSLTTLHLLDGVVDIYMPDMKYADEQIALRYSKIPNYPRVNQAAVREMYRQVGDLKIENGLATRGLLVRHLVMPGNLAGTAEIVKFIAEEISIQTCVNIMAQYHPAYLAFQIPELNRAITSEEYQQAVQLARLAGLQRLDM